MRILITADTLGGVWTYTRELVTGLVRRGVRVTLVSFGEIPSATQSRWMEHLPHLDYRPTAFKLEWMQNSASDLAASAEFLCQLSREVKPDLVHSSQFYYGALPCDVPRLVVAHSDVLSWATAVRGELPEENEWLCWYRAAVARGLQQADAVVAPSKWMIEQLSHHYGRLPHVSVVYNGRNPALFHPSMHPRDEIVSVGRLWDVAKNASLLLREEMPSQVRIIGADRHPEFQGRPLEFAEVRPNVHLEPFQDERTLAATFSKAAVYAATSQYEPFGLAPLEAALSGCAIVASDIPTFREIWGNTALYFHNNDARSLSEMLSCVISNPEIRQQYADLAFDRARDRYNADRMVDEYVELYRAVFATAAVA
jgi:glycosyltransferase involved in cell wall biosynthesis